MTAVHPVASVLGIVVHDEKVLLVRRINPPDAGKCWFPLSGLAQFENVSDDVDTLAYQARRILAGQVV